MVIAKFYGQQVYSDARISTVPLSRVVMVIVLDYFISVLLPSAVLVDCRRLLFISRFFYVYCRRPNSSIRISSASLSTSLFLPCLPKSLVLTLVMVMARKVRPPPRSQGISVDILARLVLLRFVFYCRGGTRNSRQSGRDDGELPAGDSEHEEPKTPVRPKRPRGSGSASPDDANSINASP
jgi:hypothetical protein